MLEMIIKAFVMLALFIMGGCLYEAYKRQKEMVALLREINELLQHEAKWRRKLSKQIARLKNGGEE